MPESTNVTFLMIKNFFKIAGRNLWRNKGISAINILGLSVGMAAAILIMLWVHNELGTDRFYHNSKRMYVVYSRDKLGGKLQAWNTTPDILASELKRNYPAVEDASRFRIVYFLVSAGEKHLNLRGAFADSSFLDMFDFPMLKGKSPRVLSGSHNIVLTQKLAEKLFGNEDPMGRLVRIDSTDNFIVTGVLKDLPANTTFDFEYLLPWTYANKLGWFDNSWEHSVASTYILLKEGTSQAGFDASVKDLIIKNSKATTQVFTQAVRRLYLYSKDENGKLVGGRIETVRLFMIIAGFILLIACINFMNLSTARSSKRAKEVGVRKVMGANKSSLITYFIGESTLLSGLAFIIASVFVKISLKGFDALVGKNLELDYANPYYWLLALGFILLTGIMAGSYPAFYLSSFNPAKVLKGKIGNINVLITPRKALVVLQFSFALVLIVSTIIVERQIKYAQSRDSGYDQKNIVYTFIQGDIARHYDLIKHNLLSSGAAVAVSRSANPITIRWSSSWDFSWHGSTESDRKTLFVQLGSDADFVKTMGVKLLRGRDIDIYQYPTDSMAMLLNESAAKAMRLQDPVGQMMRNKDGRVWHIVGVVKDFILESPYESRINPMIITGPTNFFQVIHFRLNPAHPTAENLAKAEKIFRQYNPQFPFEYIFVDEAYARKFQEEQRFGELAVLFAGFSIFISCLGLFGLVTFMAEARTKEIGVRKVLGASVTSITVMLSKDFIKLVALAILISTPISFLAMDKWLLNFSYRIQIGWWIFMEAGLLALFIAFLTVSYQAIKAAIANPVQSLRIE